MQSAPPKKAGILMYDFQNFRYFNTHMSNFHFQQKHLVPSSKKMNLFSFGFDDNRLTTDETLIASIRMFQDLNLFERFNISPQVIKFIY